MSEAGISPVYRHYERIQKNRDKNGVSPVRGPYVGESSFGVMSGLGLGVDRPGQPMAVIRRNQPYDHYGDSKRAGTINARKASAHETNKAFDRYCQYQEDTAFDMTKIVKGMESLSR